MLKNEGKLFTLHRAEGATDEEIRANWLRIRQEGIGGSDVAVVMGLSPWKAPYALWAEKTGRVEPDDLSDVERVQMGNELEADVREMYKRRNPKSRVRVVNAVARSIERPWAQASVDGLTSDPELGTGILEIKTGGSEEAWADGCPLYYLTQLDQYMSVTGYKFADICALIGDHGLHYHQVRVMRDEDDIKAVNSAVDDFWLNYVKKDVAPFVTGKDSMALAEANADDDGEIRDASLDANMRYVVAHYQSLGNQINAMKAERDQFGAEIRKNIGTSKGIFTGTYKATWNRGTRQSLDTKKLKAEFPDVYEQCLKETQTNVLRVSEIKKED